MFYILLCDMLLELEIVFLYQHPTSRTPPRGSEEVRYYMLVDGSELYCIVFGTIIYEPVADKSQPHRLSTTELRYVPLLHLPLNRWRRTPNGRLFGA